MVWSCLPMGFILAAWLGVADAPPTTPELQAAYDREVEVAGSLHDKDLKIVGADCHPGDPGKFVCQVGFVEANIDPDRVYLDAALVERTEAGQWKLLRGLCRRLL